MVTSSMVMSVSSASVRITFSTSSTSSGSRAEADLEDGGDASLMTTPRRMRRRSHSSSCGRKWWRDGGPWHQAATEPMPRRATIRLKVHRQVVQSIPLDEADIECLIEGLRLVTPCTQRIERLIDLLEQIRDDGRPRGDQGECRAGFGCAQEATHLYLCQHPAANSQ